MTTLKGFLRAASSDNDGGPLREILGAEIDLGTMGPYPLSTMTTLAGTGTDAPFETGEIRIEFSDVAVGAVEITDVTASEGDDAGELTVHLAPMRLHGHYSVVAIDQPHVDIDTGGSLMPLASLAGSSDQPTTSQKMDDQLNQANDQREKLKQTPAGQQLVASYHTHNDDYNTVFQTNRPLREHWKAEGATAEMADHTSSAVAAGDIPINADDRQYGPQKVTYNANAGRQAIFLITACDVMGKYEAAAAIPRFQTSVLHGAGAQPGKKKATDNLNALTAHGVYTAVGNATTDKLLGDEEHAKNVIETVRRVARNEHTEDDVSFVGGTFVELSEPVIKRVQEIHAEGPRQQHKESTAELWQGRLSCSLPESTFTFSLVDHHQGAIATTLLRQSLSIETLKVDDESWTGEAGDIAKKRVHSALFINGLMVSKISNLFEHRLAQYISSHVASDEGA